MSQLRPLLSVVAQYRLDLQTLASLRQELLNLSMLLTSIQDEIGAYDYEELQQRVLLLETRLHSCMNKLGTYGNELMRVVQNVVAHHSLALLAAQHHLHNKQQ